MPLAKSILVRENIENVLLLQIYHRDLVSDLCQKLTIGPKSFHWKVRLRFYWNNEESDSFEAILNDRVNSAYTDENFRNTLNIDASPCQLKMLSGSLGYAYEYVGKPTHIVITPLTEQCYVSMLQGINSFRVPTVIGSIGSGKKDTIKSLASTLGHNVRTINCSAQMSTDDFQWIFRGITSTGYWGILDNFNTIESTVISIVAHYFSVVSAAARLEKTVLCAQMAQKVSCTLIIQCSSA